MLYASHHSWKKYEEMGGRRWEVLGGKTGTKDEASTGEGKACKQKGVTRQEMKIRERGGLEGREKKETICK